ncbi:MAG: tetratricopeptide repeat protein [Candidatus Omnitrophica bacterium]|nr:tetratricopeptide repeat protein [Candidatus Omnitrophota bacterium]
MQKRIIAIFALAILLVLNSNLSATEIDKATGLFLLDDYDSVNRECKSIIINPSSRRDEIEYSYFLLGLSQMKEGRLDEARDSFRILIRNFPKSELVQKTHLALADTYFLEENFESALKIYSDILSRYPNSDLMSLIYFRLGQVNLKLGNWQDVRRYLKMAKDKVPNSLVSGFAKRLLGYEYFFTIQVGSFKDYKRAKSLTNELVTKDYDCYIMEAKVDNDRFYRVRVGKLSSRKEAIQLKERLSRQGYPVIIYP